MKGIILAGGPGSRLGVLSKTFCKHLLPIGKVPMIYHPISQFLCNGINNICIVSSPFHIGSVASLLGSGSKFGCEFTYKVQDEAGGIAEALNLCENFSGNDDIMVLLGDNIFGEVLEPKIENNDGLFYVKKVPDPHRFGIAEVNNLKKLIDIEEKPKNPKSNMAVVGAYIYSYKIWDGIKTIKRSERGELEISDANKWLIKNGTVKTMEIDCWWSDAGTQYSYRKANEKVWDKLCTELENMLDSMI